MNLSLPIFMRRLYLGSWSDFPVSNTMNYKAKLGITDLTSAHDFSQYIPNIFPTGIKVPVPQIGVSVNNLTICVMSFYDTYMYGIAGLKWIVLDTP